MLKHIKAFFSRQASREKTLPYVACKRLLLNKVIVHADTIDIHILILISLLSKRHHTYILLPYKDVEKLKLDHTLKIDIIVNNNGIYVGSHKPGGALVYIGKPNMGRELLNMMSIDAETELRVIDIVDHYNIGALKYPIDPDTDLRIYDVVFKSK